MSQENKTPETPGNVTPKKEVSPENWRPTDHDRIREDAEGNRRWVSDVPAEPARSAWEM